MESVTDRPDEAARPRAKVQAAVKTIQKASDLFAVAEGKLVAIRALRFGEHTFDEEQGPKPVAEIAAVLLETGAEPEPQPLGIVGITWTRVIRQLMAGEAETWHVGRLVEGDYSAKELEPPGDEVDLDAIAERLGRFHVASLEKPKQLSLPAGDAADNTDDDIPF